MAGKSASKPLKRRLSATFDLGRAAIYFEQRKLLFQPMLMPGFSRSIEEENSAGNKIFSICACQKKTLTAKKFIFSYIMNI